MEVSLRCDSQENLRQALWVRLSQVWPFHIFFRSTLALPSRGAFSLSLIKGSLGHVLGNSLLSDLDPSLNSSPWMRGAPHKAFCHQVIFVGSINHLGFRYNVIQMIGPRARFLCLCMPVI